MDDRPATAADLDEFLTRWEASGAAERANCQPFLAELCDLLGVPRPDPSRADDAENAYVFERNVTFQNPDGSTSPGRIDLYKRGCFVLEAKQGSDRPEAAGTLALPRRTRRGTAVRGTAGWDEAMLAAKGQAEQYARALPASEPMPPFLVVVDVGHTIELYADFTRQGRTYIPFPDPRSHRIKLRDLADADKRDRLRLVWTDPTSLDPSRQSARVTRDVAARLAELAKSLERSGHEPEAVAHFLMRCLFTFFAEDVGLLPADSFTELLRSLKGQAGVFPEMVRSLWETMKTGGFSPILRRNVLHFNGGLFESADALPVTEDQLTLLIASGERQWQDVEPAIFGTLLERALDERERHKLGAHYTPRAYVERLVMPTIIEPLRDEWSNVQTAAVALANAGKLPEARDEVRDFLRKLCDTIVLDPACGTGNFLYVTLEHMKRLEGEVWDTLRGLGETQTFEGFGLSVDPHQFRGIEINPRAAAIADLVLWIGYLQWHFRTAGNQAPSEPIIRAYHNIECRDAALAYDGIEPLHDEDGHPVTRWDGHSMKRHPATGEEVPDESARVAVVRYVHPERASWPKADFIIGNPPYIGNKRMRSALGDGYVEAIRSTWPDVPDTVDLVMYWWHHAAKLVIEGTCRRFGLITTNSITQTFNRKTVEQWLKDGIFLAFAIPDHPWVDSEEGAAVRVSMTVGAGANELGRLLTTIDEREGDDDAASVRFAERSGLINADLTIGADVSRVRTLRANEGLSFMGVSLIGQGFVLDEDDPLIRPNAPVKPYLIGRDLNQRPDFRHVIDFYGLTADEAQVSAPEHFQRLIDRVKPERDQNSRTGYRAKWWLFGEQRSGLRKAAAGLNRYIATCRTASHRVFSFVPGNTIIESTIIGIMIEDPFVLGVLSSRLHVLWALKAGTRLGIGNDPRYNNSVCFDPFPFPDCDEMQRQRIAGLAEKLDSHRKSRQALHPSLTITGMYNVLTQLRSGEALTDKERTIHEQGLVSVLNRIHDDLDAAVFDAYGWPHDLTDDEILARLVGLNAERAAEEARGVVRWLRPEFQHPEGTKAATQGTLAITPEEPEAEDAAAKPAKKAPWPKSLPEQVQAVRSALAAQPAGLTAERLAKTFLRARVDRISELLETLASLGQVRALGGGRYVRS